MTIEIRKISEFQKAEPENTSCPMKKLEIGQTVVITATTIVKGDYGEYVVFTTPDGKVYSGGKVVVHQSEKIQSALDFAASQNIAVAFQFMLVESTGRTGQKYKMLKEVP